MIIMNTYSVKVQLRTSDDAAYIVVDAPTKAEAIKEARRRASAMCWFDRLDGPVDFSATLYEPDMVDGVALETGDLIIWNGEELLVPLGEGDEWNPAAGKGAI